jgi:hypothetical protein
MAAKTTKTSKKPKTASKASPKASAKAAPKKAAKPAAKAPAPKKAAKPEDKKRQKANAALEEALLEVTNTKGSKKPTAAHQEESSSDAGGEEEFDPAAFFAASGGQGLLRAHVMRKERVDLNLNIRYRFLKGPLVFNADLLNLSKGGLCLRTPDVVKPKTVVKIEIPLPHTSELFAVQAEVVWSDYVGEGKAKNRPINTGLRFMPMSLAKQAVINQFIQQRRDEVIMAKIGLDKFTDSVPVAGLD